MTLNDRLQAAAELAARLALEMRTDPNTAISAEYIARDVMFLRKLAARAARLALEACNVSTDEAGEARRTRAYLRIANEAAAIGKTYGFTDVEVGGDPRGYTLTIKLRSGASNSFGGGVWGIR